MVDKQRKYKMNAAFVGGVVLVLVLYFMYTKVKAARDLKNARTLNPKPRKDFKDVK